MNDPGPAERLERPVRRGDGAFGQYCIVLPEQDAVVAITSGVRDMQAVMNLVWDKLLPAMPTISAFQPPKPGARATPGTVPPGGAGIAARTAVYVCDGAVCAWVTEERPLSHASAIEAASREIEVVTTDVWLEPAREQEAGCSRESAGSFRTE